MLVDPADATAALVAVPSDFRGSVDYRRHLATVLTARVVASLDDASSNRIVAAIDEAPAAASDGSGSGRPQPTAAGPPIEAPGGDALLTVRFTLNGNPVDESIAPHTTALQLLRRLGMMSVRYGSDTGETGASAVLIDGRLTSTDNLLAAQLGGHDVVTVESLNTARELHPIQAAFAATGAMQSGYSVGAMILGTIALLDRNPEPSEADVRDMLAGILDRETAYVKPVEAVLRARRCCAATPPTRSARSSSNR